MSRPLSTTCAALALIAMTASHAWAQGTGTISGRVIVAGTAGPLPSVEVSVPAAGIGALADADGRYVNTGVPAGHVAVTAKPIGDGTLARTVVVQPGATATVDFTLAVSALGLDAVIVTGTAGGTQRRAIGNVVTTVNAEAILETAPVTNMDQLMGQRTPG